MRLSCCWKILLLWSNSRNGLLQPYRQVFSFTEAAKEVIVLQENIAGAKGIKISQSY